MRQIDPLRAGRKLARPAAHALIAVLATATATIAAPTGAIAAERPAWTTYHRDPGRSGDDTEAGEPVAPTLAWQTPLEGGTWGQPLVLGKRVYVATADDNVYALQASTGAVIWEKHAGTPVLVEHLACEGDISPTVGIIGTPVIDPAAGAIFAVADIWNEDTQKPEHVLEGYGLAHGEPLLSTPTPVDPPGEPNALLQRTALTLDEGEVVFGMGGNDGDCGVYKGTLVAAPESGGPARFWQYRPAAPAYGGGAIWGPSGPVVDGEDNDIYLATGNPNFLEGSEVSTFDDSDAFLRLDLADLVAHPATELQPEPLGWFEPKNWKENSNSDKDLGSAGPELLPGGLLFQAGKSTTGYLLGAGIDPGGSAVYEATVCGGAKSFGGDAYASGVIYLGCENGVQALTYDQAKRTFAPLWQGPSDAFGAPIVAAGAVWVVATGGFGGGGSKLYALDPATGTPLYTETLPIPITDHFASPSAAGGRLLVADGASVAAYRIAEPPPGEETEEEETNTKTGSNPPAEDGTGPGPLGGTSSGATSVIAAWLLHSRLRVDRHGRVRLALYCASRTTACRGTVTLRAEIPVHVRGRRERTVYLTLAHARFGPDGGAFDVVANIGRTGLAHLRYHHGRLELQVTTACDGGRARESVAVLT